LRLIVSAAAAAAVLYGAVVVFGLGAASPSAIGSTPGHNTPVVQVRHDPAVPGPVQRLPQVSPGPARHRPQRHGLQRQAPATKSAASSPSSSKPRPTERTPTREPAVPRAPKAETTTPTVQLDAGTLLPLPDLALPTPPPVPQLPPPLPQLPQLPQLPATPSLPLP